MGADCFRAPAVYSAVAALFSGYGPTLAAWVTTKPEAGAAAEAVVPVLGVDAPPAALFGLFFVR